MPVTGRGQRAGGREGGSVMGAVPNVCKYLSAIKTLKENDS